MHSHYLWLFSLFSLLFFFSIKHFIYLEVTLESCAFLRNNRNPSHILIFSDGGNLQTDSTSILTAQFPRPPGSLWAIPFMALWLGRADFHVCASIVRSKVVASHLRDRREKETQNLPPYHSFGPEVLAHFSALHLSESPCVCFICKSHNIYLELAEK